MTITLAKNCELMTTSGVNFIINLLASDICIANNNDFLKLIFCDVQFELYSAKATDSFYKGIKEKKNELLIFKNHH